MKEDKNVSICVQTASDGAIIEDQKTTYPGFPPPDRCPKCGGLINSKSTMKRHAIQHENQTLLECQIPNRATSHEGSGEVGSGPLGRGDITSTEDKT